MEEKKFELPADIEMTETEKKAMTAVATFLSNQLNEISKGNLTTVQVSKEKFEMLENALKEQGVEIRVLKDKELNLANPGEGLSKMCSDLFTKENIDYLFANTSNTTFRTYTAKAVDTIMTPNVSVNAPMALSHGTLPGIYRKPIQPPAILEVLNKGGTTLRTIYWINQKDKDGACAFIEEGELKPPDDWEYFQESSQVRKIAGSGKISMEILRDFAQGDFEREVRMILQRNLYHNLDEQLLNGNGVYPNPTGILTVAGTYLGTGIDGTIKLPNNADAIRACMLQMNLLEYTPDVVFMNPTDITSIHLEKTTDGNYIRLQVENVIQGLRVISTSRIPPGKFLLMDTMWWIITILDEFSLRFGWENDDFTRNLVTVIAELSLHSFHISIHSGSMIYDEYDVIKALIEAP